MALCYGSFGPDMGVSGPTAANGAIVFGALPGIETRGFSWTPLAPNPAHPAYYIVALTAMALGGTDIAQHSDGHSGADMRAAFASGFGAVFDSGTTFIYTPTLAFRSFAATLAAGLGPGYKSVTGPDPSFPGDICYQGPPSLSADSLGDHFPGLEMQVRPP